MLSLMVAGLLLSATPAQKPDHTIQYQNASYDIYVLEDKDSERYRIRVCAEYELTGQILKRSTCNNAAAQEAVELRYVAFRDLTEIAPNMMYRRKAARAEKVGNELVNGTVSAEEFWHAMIKAIVEG